MPSLKQQVLSPPYMPENVNIIAKAFWYRPPRFLAWRGYCIAWKTVRQLQTLMWCLITALDFSPPRAEFGWTVGWWKWVG